MDENLLTARELAKYLKMQPVTIYKYASEGKIPGFRIGATWRFKRDSINKWIADKEKRLNKEF